MGAIALLERAVALGKINLAEDDPDVLRTSLQLGQTLLRDDDPMAARRVLEDAYGAGQWRLGDSDPLMVEVSHQIAVVAEELGNKHEARKAFMRVAEFGPAALGVGHPAVARARAYLGQDPEASVRAEGAPQPQSAPSPAVGDEATTSLPAAAPVSGPDNSVPPTYAPAQPQTPSYPQGQPQPQFQAPTQPHVPAQPQFQAQPQMSAPPVQQPQFEAPVQQPQFEAPTQVPVPPPAQVVQPQFEAPPVQQPQFEAPTQVPVPPPAQVVQPQFEAPTQVPAPPPAQVVQPPFEAPVQVAPYPQGAQYQAPTQPHVPTPSPFGPTSPVPAQFEQQSWHEQPPAWGQPQEALKPQPWGQLNPAVASPPYEQKPQQKRGLGLFAAIAAVLAAVIAVSALVFVLANRSGDKPDPDVPTLGGKPPTGVTLKDQGSRIQVTWQDPANGGVSFLVAMAQPGQQLKPVGTLGPGQTSFEMNALNASLNYCFAVVAVYRDNKFATSQQACTDRPTATK